jgi:proline dehydrogenase
MPRGSTPPHAVALRLRHNRGMGRYWQASMIRLAVSARAKRWAQGQRTATALARRFVGGASATDGVECARALLDRDAIRSSLFYLGEYVDTPALVAENVAAKIEVAGQLGRAGLDVHVSVDPTQIGHGLDPAQAARDLLRIGEAVAAAAGSRPGVHALMLDMEDASVTDATLDLHRSLLRNRLPAAVTLQAYRHRTETDLRALIALGAKVRLVKGAFAAGPELALTRRAPIKARSRELIALMLSRSARDSGFYPIIATHDPVLHAHARECAAREGWQRGEYEFEMLFGVRGDVAEALARAGERVRLYVPFGRDWWPYAVRRIGENPANAWLLARAVIG